MVVDAHTHAWGPPSEDHPWVNESIVEHGLSESTVEPVYTAERLLADMDDGGIDEAVVVGYPITEWTDNWYVKRVVDTFDRLTGIAMVDPFAPDAGVTVRELMGVDGILGVRLGSVFARDRMWTTFDPSATWLSESTGAEGFWRAVRETDALVQLLLHPRQLEQALTVAHTYPDVRYVIDHFAYLPPDCPPDQPARTELEALAGIDSVAIKVSSAPEVSELPHPYDDLHELIRWFVEQFGRERVIWGSDYPNVSGTATYTETRSWLEHVDGLSSRDRTWLTDRAFIEHVGV